MLHTKESSAAICRKRKAL